MKTDDTPTPTTSTTDPTPDAKQIPRWSVLGIIGALLFLGACACVAFSGSVDTAIDGWFRSHATLDVDALRDLLSQVHASNGVLGKLAWILFIVGGAFLSHAPPLPIAPIFRQLPGLLGKLLGQPFVSALVVGLGLSALATGCASAPKPQPLTLRFTDDPDHKAPCVLHVLFGDRELVAKPMDDCPAYRLTTPPIAPPATP